MGGVWEGGARGFGCHFMRGAEVGRMSLPRFEPVRTKKSFIFLVVAGGKVRLGVQPFYRLRSRFRRASTSRVLPFLGMRLHGGVGSCLPCFFSPLWWRFSAACANFFFYLSALVFAALPDTPRNGVRNEINTWATF